MHCLARRVAGLTAVSLVLAAGLCLAKPSYYLHIRAKEGGKNGVDIAFPWTPSKGGHPLSFAKDHLDVNDVDVREVWRTLRSHPEGYVVTLRDRKETTRVTREGGYCTFRVNPRHHEERVIVRVPEMVMDAITATDDAEITERDVARLVRAKGRLDLVLVDSGRDRVRVWIDTEDEWD